MVILIYAQIVFYSSHGRGFTQSSFHLTLSRQGKILSKALSEEGLATGEARFEYGSSDSKYRTFSTSHVLIIKYLIPPPPPPLPTCGF